MSFYKRHWDGLECDPQEREIVREGVDSALDEIFGEKYRKGIDIGERAKAKVDKGLPITPIFFSTDAHEDAGRYPGFQATLGISPIKDTVSVDEIVVTPHSHEIGQASNGFWQAVEVNVSDLDLNEQLTVRSLGITTATTIKVFPTYTLGQ